jgi:DNA-binding XRE family transcriptional regulator
MLARMKKHPINVLTVVEGKVTYAIPRHVAKKYIVKKTTKKAKDLIPAEEVFAKLEQRYTKAGVLLKGVRVRENLTQTEFAEKIKVTQANLSKMENGKRPIGRQIAKRIEKAFGVNYRYFLE